MIVNIVAMKGNCRLPFDSFSCVSNTIQLLLISSSAGAEKVKRMILATTGHSVTGSLDEPDISDIALLLDLDMAILAAPASAYQQYAAQIALEYAHVGPGI